MTTTQRREREIQHSILALLHARGVLAWKAGSGAFRVPTADGRERYVKMGHTGVSDLIGVLPGSGRFLAIEVKRPGHAATHVQAAFLTSVQQAGGVAFVATSCDDVARQLGVAGRLMAYLKPLWRRCQATPCAKQAVVRLLNHLNAVHGEYCRRHGEAWLAQLRAHEEAATSPPAGQARPPAPPVARLGPVATAQEAADLADALRKAGL